MRTEEEVEEYRAAAQDRLMLRCRKCHGVNPDCSCYTSFAIAVSAFEASVPQLFWKTVAKDIKRNKDVFRDLVLPYVHKLRSARLNGYGIVFCGDNGTGKTMFTSYILMRAIKKGFTVYYTTLPQLDWDLKSGFKDRSCEERLNWFMTSDFVALDEMGKEKHRATSGVDSYLNTQVERILKQRCDEKMPLILATNMNTQELHEAYGSTVGSMLTGKFTVAALAPGDYRKNLHAKMVADMGYRV
jgi:DNA replication protein DnaC